MVPDVTAGVEPIFVRHTAVEVVGVALGSKPTYSAFVPTIGISTVYVPSVLQVSVISWVSKLQNVKSESSPHPKRALKLKLNPSTVLALSSWSHTAR